MHIALISSVFVSSLLGSGHCVSMCGPFLFIASGRSPDSDQDESSGHQPLVRTTLYNLGRLTVYLVFGVIAGCLGMLMQTSGNLLGLQQTAIFFSGIVLILMGIFAIMRNFGVRMFRFNAESIMMPFLKSGMRSSKKLRPGARAFVIGTLTSLMPCGWLYVYVIAASSTQSIIFAPVVMAIFWLGTMPVMTVFGWTSGAAMGAFRQKAAWVMPVAMVVVGVMSIAFRSPIDMSDFSKPNSVSEISKTIEEVDQDELPCCSENES